MNVPHASSMRWHAQALLQSNVWREEDAAGGRILEERGALQGVALGGSGRVSGVTWSITAQAFAGVRDYDGRTNQGTPLLTRSDVQDTRLSLALRVPISSHWHWGLMAEPSRTLRNLRGTASALGYRETWRWTLAQASLHWLPAGEHGGWSARAGWGVAFRPTVHLTLPSFDPAVLHPGQGRSLQVDVQYRGPLVGASAGAGQHGWHWVTGLGWQRQTWGASAAELLTRQGVWQGGISQPRTVIEAVQWRLGVETDWP